MKKFVLALATILSLTLANPTEARQPGQWGEPTWNTRQTTTTKNVSSNSGRRQVGPVRTIIRVLLGR